MKFCPECGNKLTPDAKFCTNCGARLIDPGTTDDSKNSATSKSASESTLDEKRRAHRAALQDRYYRNLQYPQDKNVCAVDCASLGIFAKSVRLSDGYYVCEKHFKQVFVTLPEPGMRVPPLVLFLERLDDPNHQLELLPVNRPTADAQPTSNQSVQNQQPVQPNITVNVSIPQNQQRSFFHTGLHCPRCKSSNVSMDADDANVKKVKKSTSINLNPLHPLTMVNHHEKVVKKHSAGKIAAGIMTGGASLLVTGTHNNKAHTYRCLDCGKVWNGK